MKPWAHSATTTDFAKKQRLAVTRDLLQLFIGLDKRDDSVLKKAVSAIRNKLESAREQEVEVIDVDALSNNFNDVTATPKVPSLQRAVDEDVAASVLTMPTLASKSPTPTGTSSEEVVAPSAVKYNQKQSTPLLIPLNPNCFQPPNYLLDRGDHTEAAKRQVESRAVLKITNH